MRTRSFTPLLAALALALLTAPALAAPVTVNVRVEGKTETLFEGPIETEGHSVKTASEALSHECDGTNAHRSPSPGATPTAAAVDAMSIAGQSFDGIWEEGKQDFKITRWGPDSASVAEGEFWGVLVDQTLTSVGGCQVELAPGAQVLWMYNAFAGYPFLTLYAGSEPSGALVATATVEVGKPLTVSVGQYTSSEGTHHAVKPFTAGAQVAPVITATNGFQKIDTTSAEAITTNAAGTAQITFTTPGWHRLKASASEAFRSNRLDVCVQPCGPLPADDDVRSVSGGSAEPPEEPIGGTKPAEPTPVPPQAPSPQPETQPMPAPAPLGDVSAFTAPAAAQLRLGSLLLAPSDDRAPTLSYHGRWRRITEAGAWQHTLSVGGPGASVSVHLARGRPVFIVRDVHRRARVAVQWGSHHEQLTIAASASGASRPLLLPRRASAGVVTLRVLSGTVGIDGVALTP